SVLQSCQVCEFRLIQIADILKELSGNHVAKCFSLHTKSVTSQDLSDLLQGSELQNSDLYMCSLPCIFSFCQLSCFVVLRFATLADNVLQIGAGRDFTSELPTKN